jgi:hypothetical protein
MRGAGVEAVRPAERSERGEPLAVGEHNAKSVEV